MPDKKLTDDEIVKAWKDEIHLAEYVDSDFCNGVSLSLVKSTLDLINRKNAECKECGSRTSESIEKLQKQIAEKNAENERLSTLGNLANVRANDYRVMRDRALKAEAENERLKKILNTDFVVPARSGGKKFLLQMRIAAIKAEAYKEFAKDINAEIDDAINSNYKVREERVAKLTKFGIPTETEHGFLMYCDGKIHALSGISSFIDDLIEQKVQEG